MHVRAFVRACTGMYCFIITACGYAWVYASSLPDPASFYGYAYTYTHTIGWWLFTCFPYKSDMFTKDFLNEIVNIIENISQCYLLFVRVPEYLHKQFPIWHWVYIIIKNILSMQKHKQILPYMIENLNLEFIALYTSSTEETFLQ